MAVIVILAWLFRDELVRVRVAEQAVPTGEVRPGNVVEFNERANAA